MKKEKKKEKKLSLSKSLFPRYSPPRSRRPGPQRPHRLPLRRRLLRRQRGLEGCVGSS